jgi:predicted RNase H-like HicB family nuclease
MVGRTRMQKPVGYIQVTLIASEEEGGYASICPELGIASQGETADEALASLRDATMVFLNTIEQLGQRERVFKERHIRVHPHEPTEVTIRLQRPSQIGSFFVAPTPMTGSRRKSALVGA